MRPDRPIGGSSHESGTGVRAKVGAEMLHAALQLAHASVPRDSGNGNKLVRASPERMLNFV